MERRIPMWAGLSLALAVSMSAAGCRTPRSEIPPAKTYPGTVQPGAPMTFGSAPNNGNGFSAMSSVAGDGRGSHDGAGTIGTPAPRSDSYGLPAAGGYGAPGTNMGTTAPATSAAAGATLPPTGAAPAAAAPAATTPNPASAPTQGLFQQ